MLVSVRDRIVAALTPSLQPQVAWSAPPLREPSRRATMSANQTHEEGHFATTFERKYYHRGRAFIKRSLRPHEYRTGHRGLHIPPLNKERLLNEAESLHFIKQHTDVPVPAVHCHFEDDGAYYLITEYVDGVNMSDLPEAGKAVVRRELETQLAKLKALKSSRLGGPSGLVIPPYRVLRRAETDHHCWDPTQRRLSSHETEYVFCHNDLSQQNVIVDLDTLKINAIIDWEYAGFFPARFEYRFYRRLGPSAAIDGEADDSLDLLNFLLSGRVATS